MSTNIGFPVNRVPDYVRNVAQTLTDNGFEAYLVGGAVRDLLLERKTKDFDITTNALPDQIISIFPKSVTTGAKFGNIIIVAEDEYKERHDVDVTTFRKDENYFGGRWPSEVKFSGNIKDDLSRRDFTINALAIDLNLIINDSDQFLELDQIVDPHNGLADLIDGNIKAVGNPDERFKEDGLRAFRACRLASELNFTIEPDTKEAIKTTTNIAKMISMERIRDEFNKMIYHSKTPSTGIKLMDELGLLELFIPELLDAKNLTQPEWHTEDVYTHSLHAMDIAEDEIKLAALLHDIGKTETQSKDEKGTHFYGHDVKGAEMTKEILKRMRFSNSEVERISNLVRWHMFYYPSADWRKDNDVEEIEVSNEEKEIRQNAFKHGWTDSSIRKFIRNVGGIDQLEDLIKLRIADASANEKSSFNPKELQALEERVSSVLEKDMALKVTDLEISGNDLINIGIPAGQNIGIILNNLLDKVTEEPNLNNHKDLIRLAEQVNQENI